MSSSTYLLWFPFLQVTQAFSFFHLFFISLSFIKVCLKELMFKVFTKLYLGFFMYWISMIVFAGVLWERKYIMEYIYKPFFTVQLIIEKIVILYPLFLYSNIRMSRSLADGIFYNNSPIQLSEIFYYRFVNHTTIVSLRNQEQNRKRKPPHFKDFLLLIPTNESS